MAVLPDRRRPVGSRRRRAVLRAQLGRRVGRRLHGRAPGVPPGQRVAARVARRSRAGGGQDGTGLAEAAGRHQLVELPEDQRVDLADLRRTPARRPRRTRSTQPSHLTATATSGAGPVGQRVEGDDVERADDGAHRTADAARRVHQHHPSSSSRVMAPGRADLQARGRVAVAAAVGEGESWASGPASTWTRLRGTGDSRNARSTSWLDRVLDGTGQLALQAADAPLGVDEHGLHRSAPFVAGPPSAGPSVTSSGSDGPLARGEGHLVIGNRSPGGVGRFRDAGTGAKRRPRHRRAGRFR